MTTDRDLHWAQTAIQHELLNIAACHDDNPNRPDSEWWKCVIRIASVVKGSGKHHFTPSNVLTAVLRESPQSLRTKGNRETNLTYLWSRAMNAASPRYRKPAAGAETNKDALSPDQPVAGYIAVYDLTQHKWTHRRPYTSKTAVKAQQLANGINVCLLTGEMPSQYRVTLLETYTEKVTVLLQFRTYSQALHDCVIVACAMLNGSMDEDQRNGCFTAILPR